MSVETGHFSSKYLTQDFNTQIYERSPIVMKEILAATVLELMSLGFTEKEAIKLAKKFMQDQVHIELPF